ncbi:hypothetical protein BGZ98_008549 [Dissophora globulifera]|nr:hypothetical protein BGZ98_008549 [Dissophora globulifera]
MASVSALTDASTGCDHSTLQASPTLSSPSTGTGLEARSSVSAVDSATAEEKPSLSSSSSSSSSPSSSSSSTTPYPLLSNNARCCRICLDDDPHGLRKSLMAHGRDESANSCSMCGFNYVLKKRARFYELISYKGIRVAITVLFVLALLFPSGYIMKACVLLSGYRDVPGTAPTTYLSSLRDISANMDEMVVFPVCKANSKRLSFGKFADKAVANTATVANCIDSASTSCSDDAKQSGASPTSSGAAMMSSPSHFISLLPGPYASRIANSNMYASTSSQAATTASGGQTSHQDCNQNQGGGDGDSSDKTSTYRGSWARLAAGIDIVGSSQFATLLLYPFANDRLWYFLLCRLQHLHLGFFLLGSASNVYMACKMLSDMYDLIITPPHSRTIKNVFLLQASVFVVWFWFSYNLMAFRVSTTEEEFMSELPLWALRWINVGVAIVDLSYRRIYNRLGRLKLEEELLDISDVEKVEQMQQKAWLHQQVLEYGQEQGQYLLDQFMALEVSKSIVNGANAAVDAVSDVYSKTSIPSFPPISNSLASAVTMMSSSSTTTSASSCTSDSELMDTPAATVDIQQQQQQQQHSTVETLLANPATAPSSPEMPIR